jgi:hypothetical protein
MIIIGVGEVVGAVLYGMADLCYGTIEEIQINSRVNQRLKWFDHEKCRRKSIHQQNIKTDKLGFYPVHLCIRGECGSLPWWENQYF